MTIEEVIKHTVRAVFADSYIHDRVLLKGGQALRLGYGIDQRLSFDIDFSVSTTLKDDKVFFGRVEKSLVQEFKKSHLHVFDFKYQPRPRVKENVPSFWGGWEVEFKLIDEKNQNLPQEQKSRQALQPTGFSSSKMRLDISEYEYCNSFQEISIDKNMKIRVYTPEMLVVEKLRAICHQHPDYTLKKTSTNRARDYYDIVKIYEQAVQNGTSEDLIRKAKANLRPVFDAKEVPLHLLQKILEPSFIEIQATGWNTVSQTVSERLQSFDYYYGIVKAIIEEITEGIDD